MAPHSSTLTWKIPWTEEPGGLPSMGPHRVGHGWSDLACMHVWRPTRPFRPNTPKRCPFHYRGLECKSRKSEISGVTGKFGCGVQNETGQRLIEFYQENTLVIANTLFQQHKTRLDTWTSPDGQYQNQIDYSLQPKMEKLYTISKNKTGSWLLLRSWILYCQIQI